jgi:WD40 repeat protein
LTKLFRFSNKLNTEVKDFFPSETMPDVLLCANLSKYSIKFYEHLKAWLGCAWERTFNMTTTTLTSWRNLTGHGGYVWDSAQINSNQIVTVSEDWSMIVWNINTGAVVNTYAALGQLRAVAVLPSGFIATGGYDNLLSIWDMTTLTVTAYSMPGVVSGLIVNRLVGSNGTLVVTTGNFLYYYDAITMTQTVAIACISYGYWGLEVLRPSGNVIASSNTMEIYSTTGSLVYSYAFPSATQVQRLKLLPDNVTVVLCHKNGSVGLFNSNSHAMGATLSAHSYMPYLITITPDSLYVITGANDLILIMWSWSTMSLTQKKVFTIPGVVVSGLVLPTTYTGILKLFFI